MDYTKPREMDFYERANWFHELYDHDNDAAITLVEIVRAAGDFLEKIIGSKAVDAGMKQVIGPMSSSGPSTWREDLDDNQEGAFTEWPLGQMLHDLSAYARYGIDISVREHETEHEIAQRIKNMVDKADAFLELCPLDIWLGEERPPQLEDTILMARNRWALDHDRPIDPQALAKFGEVKMSRMRNMLAGKNPELPRDNGLVPAYEAKEWLAKRDCFYPSIWRTARPTYEPEDDATLYYQPIFVPKAKDGSVFHPGLERRNGFTIGEKGSEIQAATFEAALEKLQEMPAPAWRRPSQGRGGWSVVRGVNWARMSQAELDSRARSEREVSRQVEEDTDHDE